MFLRNILDIFKTYYISILDFMLFGMTSSRTSVGRVY